MRRPVLRVLEIVVLFVVALWVGAYCHTASAQELDETNDAAAQEPEVVIELPDVGGLETLWTQPGAFTGVAVDAESNIYAVTPHGQCFVFDSSGELLRKFFFAAAGHDCVLQIARGPAPNDVTLLIRDGSELSALSTKGKRLWQTGRLSRGDFCVADLNNDGIDEIIFACQYDKEKDGKRDADATGTMFWTSIRAVDHAGKMLWTVPANSADSVCAADLDGDGQIELIATAHKPRLSVISRDGKQLEAIEGPLPYSGSVGIVRLPNEKADRLLAVQNDSLGEGESTQYFSALVSLNTRREVASKFEFPDRVGCGILSAKCPNRPWVAIDLDTISAAVHPSQEAICIADIAQDKLIASFNLTGRMLVSHASPQVAWLKSSEKDDAAPVMLLVYGQSLTAFAVRPKDPAEAQPNKPGDGKK